MPRKRTHLGVGRQGEQIAAEYLRQKGYREVARNWTCGMGELDLIFWDKCELVFVEVKTRRESPLAARYLLDGIDQRKRRKLRKLAQYYLYRKYWRKVPPHRIDVLGVIIKHQGGEALEIRHLLGAIGSDD